MIYQIKQIIETIERPHPTKDENHMDYIPDSEMLQNVLKDLKALVSEPKIALIWSATDLRSQGWICSDEQAQNVLELVEETNDCEYGVSWATIENACETLDLEHEDHKF